MARSAAERGRQCRQLRDEGFAFTRAIVSGAVLTMLIREGFLPGGDGHSEVEIERASSLYMLTHAGEKKVERVSAIMRRRWHSTGNQESRR